MALTHRETLSNEILDLCTGKIDGGTLEIRSGPKPASPNDAAAGTLLATLTFNADAFPAAAVRSADVNTIAAVAASASGEAAHFRAKSSGGTAYIDGTVTEAGGGGDLELDSVDITSGQDVEVTGGNWLGPL
jgi:hypothetical protein